MGPVVKVRQVLANRRVPRNDQTITCGSVHSDKDVQKFPENASKRGFSLSIGRCGVMSLRKFVENSFIPIMLKYNFLFLYF